MGIWKAKEKKIGKNGIFSRSHDLYFKDLRSRFPLRNEATGLILCEMIPCYNVSHCFLNTAHIAGELLGANIGVFTFNFSEQSESWQFWKHFYRECGAPLVLTNQKKIWNRWVANFMAWTIFRPIKTPQDVLNIRLGPVLAGPLIYQTYLGVERATMDVRDPYLFQTILYACHIYLNSQSCFRRFLVKQVVISHNQYIQYGILTRLAIAKGIPVITPYAHGWRRTIPFTLRRTDPISMMPFPPYYKFRALFKRLSKREQAQARIRGRKKLLTRLSGRLDLVALKTGPGFTPQDKQILLPTKKKKVLLLLNCFFDGPNIFRFNLFPDFYQWAVHTLEKARQTEYEWYIKPHPVGVAQNDRVMHDLKTKFPEAIYLPKETSSWGLLNNGLSAVFTTHGTCIHEFAYRGVPVVATGDNFHIDYRFYLLPKSLEEYDRLILSAGNLRVSARKRDIEEFVFMNYLRFLNHTKKCRLFPANYEDYLVKQLKFNPLRNYLNNPRALHYLVRHRKLINYREVGEYVKKFVLNPSWDESPPLF